MLEMSQEIIDLINGDAYCYLATTSKDGTPNMAIFASTTAVGPDTVLIAACYTDKTYHNLLENPKAAAIVYSSLPPERTKVSMADFARAYGVQVKGSVSILTSGDIHEQMKSIVTERYGSFVANSIKATYVLKVEEIYQLQQGLWKWIKNRLVRFIPGS